MGKRNTLYPCAFCSHQCRCRSPLEIRLWSKVNKNGPVPEHRPELGPCWLWTAKTNDAGYARISFGPATARKHLYVHRVVWELTNEAIPDGFVIDHLCRNPSCCNPEHLEPVPQRINVIRGAGTRGERNGYAKGTNATVQAIRDEYTGERGQQAALAKKYKMSPSAVGLIVRGKIWCHML